MESQFVYSNETRAKSYIMIGKVSSRDLSGIVSATSSWGMSCPPPKVTRLAVPEVIELRPNVFHGGGLMLFEKRSVQYIVPNVFSATKWVRRKLEADETLLALDVPPEVMVVLRSGQNASLCEDRGHIPLKCTLALVHALGFGLLDEYSSASDVINPMYRRNKAIKLMKFSRRFQK